MKQLLRTSFLGPIPRVFPPPGDCFSTETTENRNYNWACHRQPRKQSSQTKQNKTKEQKNQVNEKFTSLIAQY